MHKAWVTLRTAFKEFMDDECVTSGAALAYYTIFSLPPLLVLVFSIVGALGVSQDRVNEVIGMQLGISTDAIVAPSDDPAPAESGGEGGERPPASPSLWAKIASIVLLIVSATGVFGQLQRALNRAWEVEPDPEAGGWHSFLLKRVLSFGMILVITFLLLVSLVLTTFLGEIIRIVQGHAPSLVGATLGVVANWVLSLALATMLFAAVFKVLPDAKMRWRDLWGGAFLTAFLFIIGKYVIGWYLRYAEVGASWGSAAASLVAVLVWVYYTSLIVLFGAELTHVWVTRFGGGIVPSRGAVRVVQQRNVVR